MDPPPRWLVILITTATTLSAFLYALYLYLLPKPIPGIPHNEDSTKSLLGDIPRMQKESPNGIFEWIIKQSRRHGSPIFQVFLGPLQKPSVIITDFREGQDILMRRKEFDRSDFTINVLGGEARSFHITLKTGTEWKAHRRLLQDLMTPRFLHDDAAPNIYNSALRLLDLWEQKARLAKGKPFLAEKDIFYAALDAVFDFGFGDAVQARALIPQNEKIRSLTHKEIQQLHNTATGDKAIAFPIAPIDLAFEATLQSVENITGIAETGVPQLAWSLVGLTPRVRRMRALRDAFLKEQILSAADKCKSQGQDSADEHVRSAIDLIVQREKVFAAKDGREPIFWCDTIRDETLGFVVAGHDTTSTTLCWGLKFLADNPDVEQKLLERLHSAHATALTEKRLPSHDEITGSRVPYLDAVVDEMLRLAHTAPSQDRQCKEDTIVLGHHIPKGTTVFILNKGPSFTEPGYDIDERLRSATCQAAAREHGIRAWADDNMDKFKPERWLVQENDGHEAYSAIAGPTLPFGLGLRGCWGRKLAYMELKLLTTLLVWAFEFQRCPESLSGYADFQSLTRKPLQCYVSLKAR